MKSVICHAHITLNVEIFDGDYFSWVSNTHNNWTHKNLHTQRISNSVYGGLCSPTKIYTLNNLIHKILWPEKFVRLGYSCSEVRKIS